SGGRIEIGADCEDGMLHLFVRDDGRGLVNGQQEALKEGVGLANTRARLAHLYGAAHRFDLKNSPGGGLTVDLTIPFRNSDDEEAGSVRRLSRSFRNSLISDDEDSHHSR
ncbi:MAG: hypothetical protein JOZ52_04835, partial [Acidobacteria bacterium]|nr:hypothetical protein [Acidobacteriota bacterium]